VQTIFVTGAEGFAGSLLARQLCERGYQVVAGVRNRARKLAYERRQGKAIVCDVADAINVARAVAALKPDGIVHLAGPSDPRAAVGEPLEAYQSIVSGWANLLDAVRRIVPRARVLLVSACDVYGAAGADGKNLREDTPPQPVSTFGALKLTAESIAHTFFKKYHLNLTIARPFHYVGPGQPENSFYASAARRLASWEPATGEQEWALPELGCRRDLLHVQDVIDAYERLLLDGKPDEVYNVCSGEGRTLAEIIQVMAQAARVPIRLTESGTPTNGEFVSAYVGDSTKLRAELSWQPTRTVDGALQELVRSYCQRPAAQAAVAKV